MDRMYCYLWVEEGDEGECKFGERWVKSGQDPRTECLSRIRESVGVRKDRFDDGRIRLIAIWDVSEEAKKVGRYHQRSKMDDYLREHIGFRKGSTGEVHKLSGEEMQLRVNLLLAKLGQPLITAKLSTKQYLIAQEVLAAFAQGKRIVLSELCARFGKTIWSGAVAAESDADLVIVASYVKTVFTSFASDITSYQQFAHYVHVDTADDDYQQKIADALSQDKQVFAYLSLNNGSRRQERIDFLFAQPAKQRMLIVDEADFGAHQIKQAKPLVDKMDGKTLAVIMTGTNSDRAVTHWPIDTMTSVTYPELLVQKHAKQHYIQGKSGTKALKNFAIDTARDLLVPDFRCYQMDLNGPVNAAIAAGEVDDEFKLLPSWSKFAAHPIKSKGFFSRVLESLFKGQGGHDELNVDLQIGNLKPERKVVMMFFSAHNPQLQIIGNIAAQTLQGFEIIVLCGATMHNGRKITNRRAEQAVKEVISTGKNVLIIASHMAQRSFSIPEITELYLAYDRGENGATIQKMSRTLTPNGLGKIGNIFSLSFDPNRDDKFDPMILETALNHKKRTEGKSLQEAMRDVLRTIDIFRCTPDGSVKVDVDTFLAASMARKGISRVLGKIVDMSLLSASAIKALASGKADYFRNAAQDVTLHGKTRENAKRNSSGNHRDLNSEKELAEARKVITAIIENLDIIILGTNNSILVDAMVAVENDPEMYECVEEEFGVPVETISYLFKQGAIKQEWVELMYDNA
jgi:hypothetical protein